MGASEFHATRKFLPATVHLPPGTLTTGHGRPTLPHSVERQFVDERWTDAGNGTPKADGPSVIDLNNDETAEATTAHSGSAFADSPAVANYQAAADKTPDIISLLPRFRRVARGLVDDAVAADKLVELTLERAVAGLRSREDHHHVESWLTALLEDTFERIGPDLRRLFTTREQ